VSTIFIRETNGVVKLVLGKAQSLLVLSKKSKIDLDFLQIKTTGDKEGFIKIGLAEITVRKDEVEFHFEKICTVTLSLKQGCIIQLPYKVKTNMNNASIVGNFIETTLSDLKLAITRSLSIEAQKLVVAIPDILFKGSTNFAINAVALAIAAQEMTVKTSTVDIAGGDGIGLSAATGNISLTSKAGVSIASKPKKEKASPGSVLIKGDTLVDVDALKIQLGGLAEGAVLGVQFQKQWDALVLALITAASALEVGSATPTPAGLTAGFLALKTALNIIKPQTSTMISKKVKLG